MRSIRTCIRAAFVVLASVVGGAQADTFEVRGFEIVPSSVALPASIDTDALLRAYLGPQESFTGLREAAAALQAALHEQGLSNYRVVVPAQQLKGGIVQLEVVVYHIGQVSVAQSEAPAYFDADNIRRALPALVAGAEPDLVALSRQLALANEHPAKELKVTFREGLEKRTVDAIIEVEDTRSYGISLSAHNHTSADTPNSRITLGLYHANLFNLDHVVNATYTTAPGAVDDVEQYGVSYFAPIYGLAGSLSLYGVRSRVDSGTVGGGIEVTGRGTFLGARYKQHLRRIGVYTHAASVAISDSLFDNETRFAGTDTGSDVRSRPLALGYQGQALFSSGGFAFNVGYHRNLPGGSHNDQASYNRSRPGADDDWHAVRMAAHGAIGLPKAFELHLRARAQLADEPLISGEQIGIGGVNSVRGFEERFVTGDKGLSASAELWSPPLFADIRLLGFADAGYVARHAVSDPSDEAESLASAGLGARWSVAAKGMRPGANVQLDLGVVTNGMGVVEPGDVRFSFNVGLRY